MHPCPTCIVVADEHAARFFHRSSPTSPLVEVLEFADSADILERDETPPRDLRRVNGRTSVRPRAEKSGEMIDRFLKRVARRIDEGLGALKAEHLVLCAPALVLAKLRDAIGARSRDHLICEIRDDLVSHPIPAIEANLSSHGV
jgi:protein required for attachment to host cells